MEIELQFRPGYVYFPFRSSIQRSQKYWPSMLPQSLFLSLKHKIWHLYLRKEKFILVHIYNSWSACSGQDDGMRSRELMRKHSQERREEEKCNYLGHTHSDLLQPARPHLPRAITYNAPTIHLLLNALPNSTRSSWKTSRYKL